MRIENPGVLRACQILQSGRQINPHRRHRPLHTLLVLLQIILGAVAFAHAQYANRPLRPRQLSGLYQSIQGLGRTDNRGHAGGVVVRALLEQMAQ